jgi:hypothetical protein
VGPGFDSTFALVLVRMHPLFIDIVEVP